MFYISCPGKPLFPLHAEAIQHRMGQLHFTAQNRLKLFFCNAARPKQHGRRPSQRHHGRFHPTWHGPPSQISGSRQPISSPTSAALVGLGLPERLAEERRAAAGLLAGGGVGLGHRVAGHAHGQPFPARRRLRVAHRWGRGGSTMVRGPGPRGLWPALRARRRHAGSARPCQHLHGGNVGQSGGYRCGRPLACEDLAPLHGCAVRRRRPRGRTPSRWAGPPGRPRAAVPAAFSTAYRPPRRTRSSVLIVRALLPARRSAFRPSAAVSQGVDHLVQGAVHHMASSRLYRVRPMRWSVTRPCG